VVAGVGFAVFVAAEVRLAVSVLVTDDFGAWVTVLVTVGLGAGARTTVVVVLHAVTATTMLTAPTAPTAPTKSLFMIPHLSCRAPAAHAVTARAPPATSIPAQRGHTRNTRGDTGPGILFGMFSQVSARAWMVSVG
jgi:hypothetical protein